MKNICIIIGIILAAIGLSSSLYSCKKVDQYAKVVSSFPSLDGTYSTIYIVGDTMTVTGRMFLGEGSNHIQVGNAAAVLYSLTATSTTDTTLQMARFIITTAMGVGSNISVALIANGYTVDGPKITIKQFNLSAQTDTTLWVDQIGSWLPANVSYFQNNGIPLVLSSNTSLNGLTCFYNPLGLYTVSTTSGVQPALLQGAVLTEANVVYSIDQLAGGAISADGTTLYFSAAVLENSPDTATNLIFRLAKMKLGDPSTVTTLNRTLVPKMGTTNEVMKSVQGTLSSLEEVAVALQTDLNGNLYFINFYPPQQTGVAEGGPSGTLYQQLSMGLLQYYGTLGLGNICQVTSGGALKSIFSSYWYTGSIVPGYTVDWTYYAVDEAGTNIYGSINDPAWVNSAGFIDWIGYSLSYYYPLFTIKPQESDYSFESFDTSAQTKIPSGYSFQTPELWPNFDETSNNILPLPNGTVLMPMGSSVVALLPTTKFAYCYAGTEVGLTGAPPGSQSNLTGRAKWVDFSQTWGGYGGVSGIDQQGAVYYFSNVQDYAGGIHFYKLYSKP